MTIDEMIASAAVLQAAKEGKPVQWKRINGAKSINWVDLGPANDSVDWNFTDFVFRVKPNPRCIWINEFVDGLSCVYHQNEEDAKQDYHSLVRTIKFVEVIE